MKHYYHVEEDGVFKVLEVNESNIRTEYLVDSCVHVAKEDFMSLYQYERGYEGDAISSEAFKESYVIDIDFVPEYLLLAIHYNEASRDEEERALEFLKKVPDICLTSLASELVAYVYDGRGFKRIVLETESVSSMFYGAYFTEDTEGLFDNLIEVDCIRTHKLMKNEESAYLVVKNHASSEVTNKYTRVPLKCTTCIEAFQNNI